MIECKICKKYRTSDLRGLASHIFIHHKYRMKDYYDEFLKIEGEGICPVCLSLTKFNGYRNGYRKYCSQKCQSNSILEKKKLENTCLKRYGVKNPSQIDSIKEKKKKSCFDHFGYEHPFQSPEVQYKSKMTCMKKYGVNSHNQVQSIKDKQYQTTINRFDGIGFSSEDIRKRIETTCFCRYGVNNYSQTEFFRSIARERFHDFGFPPKGKNEDQIIRELEIQTGYHITRNKKVAGFYPDGVIECKDIIIEIDEAYHQKKWAKIHDQRKNRTYDKLGYIVFRFKDQVWFDDSNLIICQLREVINGRI